MYAEIRNNYTWGPAVESGSVPSECGDLLAAVTIDGWRTGCDAEQGAVIAMVSLTKHGDIVTDFHDNGARMDTEVLSAIKGAKESLKGIWTDEKERRRRTPKKSGNSVTYQQVLYVPGSVLQTIRGFLQARSEAEYQGEDNTITYTAKFPDGKEMDIKCCGCRNESSWTEAVLFDEKGFQLTYSEVAEEFEGPWELEYNSVHYCVDVRPDTADSKQVVDNARKIAYNVDKERRCAMSKNVSMNIRVDESTRLEAESIFEQLGLTMSGAINMFLKQVVREKAVPLSMELDPMFTSRTVKEDMEEARKMRADNIAGVDADDLAAQMDAIIARAEARL